MPGIRMANKFGKIAKELQQAIALLQASKVDRAVAKLQKLQGAAEGVGAAPAAAKGTGRKSGFIVFSNEQRAALQQLHPALKVTEIAKKLGLAWKALSEAERQQYNAEAAKLSGSPAAASPKKGRGKKQAGGGEETEREIKDDRSDASSDISNM